VIRAESPALGVISRFWLIVGLKNIALKLTPLFTPIAILDLGSPSCAKVSWGVNINTNNSVFLIMLIIREDY
jgi:hypothetical protein